MIKQTWASDNGKWKIVLFENESSQRQLNIQEQRNSMLTHIHMGRIQNKCLMLQANNHTKRIPKYVKAKVLELAN